MPNPTPNQPSKGGPAHRVPCPFCGGLNDFRDIQNGMAGQGFVDTGDDVDCDHCKGTMRITGMNTVTIVTVAQQTAPRRRPAANQAQRQQQQRPSLGGALRKLLGK